MNLYIYENVISKSLQIYSVCIHVLHIKSDEDFRYFYKRNEVQFVKKLVKDIFHSNPLQISAHWANLHLFS